MNNNFQMNDQQKNIINALESQKYFELNKLLDSYTNSDNDHMFAYHLLMNVQNYTCFDNFKNSHPVHICPEKILFFVISRFDFNNGMQDWSRNKEMFPEINNEKITYNDMLFRNFYFSSALFNVYFEKYDDSSNFIQDCLYRINQNSNHLDSKYEIYDRLKLILGNTNHIYNLYSQTIYNKREITLHSDSDYLCYVFKDWFGQTKKMPKSRILEENSINLSHFLNYITNFLIDNEKDINVIDYQIFDNIFSNTMVWDVFYENNIESLKQIKKRDIEILKTINQRKNIHPFIKIASIFNDFIEDNLKIEILEKNYKFIKTKQAPKINKLDKFMARFNNWNIEKPIEIWPTVIKNKHIGLMDYLLDLNINVDYSEKEYGQWIINGIDKAKYKSDTSIKIMNKLSESNIINQNSSDFLFGLLSFNETWIKDPLRKEEFKKLLKSYINDVGQHQYINNIIEIKSNVNSENFNSLWNNLRIVYSDLFLLSANERDELLNIDNFNLLETNIIKTKLDKSSNVPINKRKIL